MRNHRLTLIIAVIVTMAAMSLQAAVQSMPIVEILGTKFYLYETKKNDTMFGVARANGWDEKELARLNPAVTSPFKKGVKLYYPVNPSDGRKIEAEDVHTAVQTELSHLVKKGETVYSISQMYGMPVETIYSLNPDSRNGIRVGQNLILRKDASIKGHAGKNADSHFYTVRKGDSIYGVAKEKGVSVAALMKANPAISEENFKEGTVIKLPPRGTGKQTVTKQVEESRLDSFRTHEVKKNETWSSIARKEGVDVQLLKDVNPGIEKPKNNQVIAVPNIETITVEQETIEEDPREQAHDGIREIYEDVHKVADDGTQTVRVAILVENPSGKKDLDFIRGFLAAVYNLEKKSYKVDIKVMDGSGTGEHVVTELDSFKPTIVFMTFDNEIPSYITEYSEASQTPVVNSFNVKAENYTSNPYFVQLLAPSNYFNDGIAVQVHEKYGDRTLVLIGEEDPGDQLAASLLREWDTDKIKKVSLTSFEASDFENSGQYVFYGYETKKAEVHKLLSEVAAIREVAPLGDYLTLGRPNWIVYDESLADELHRANTMIPSRFYLDDKSPEATRFQAEFKDLFDRQPIRSLPLYAGVGYDSACYFIPGLAEVNGDINALRPFDKTVQSSFDLKRVSSWGGLVNVPVYLVHFTTFDTVDKIVVD